jgi:hypothetical protein
MATSNNIDIAAMMQRKRATPEQLAVFLQGLDAVLLQWTALNLIVEHNDSNAANEMRNVLHSWFAEEGEVYSDELEDCFDHFFLDTRNAALEDGSPKEVADALHQMYYECCANNDESVRRYQQMLVVYQQSGVTNMCTFEGGEGDDDDAGDDDEVPYDDDLGEGAGYDEDDADAPPPLPQQQQQQQKSKGKGKNTYTTSAGGWKTIVRK